RHISSTLVDRWVAQRVVLPPHSKPWVHINTHVFGEGMYLYPSERPLFLLTRRTVPCAGENVALGGRAAQSSLYDRGFPANAIDGNRDAAYVHGSCTRTVKELSPWWRLDLLNRHKVFNITVTPSLGAHSVQPKGAEIRIGDSLENHGNRNPRCGVIGTARRDPTFTFNCKGMEGRYINIVIPGRSESLSLCEVEVYGAPLD
ncbi:hypothetical protein NFI96_030955, partial [Prochilodus magdalenae]